MLQILYSGYDGDGDGGAGSGTGAGCSGGDGGLQMHVCACVMSSQTPKVCKIIALNPDNGHKDHHFT